MRSSRLPLRLLALLLRGSRTYGTEASTKTITASKIRFLDLTLQKNQLQEFFGLSIPRKETEVSVHFENERGGEGSSSLSL